MPVTIAPERLVNTVTTGSQSTADVAVGSRVAATWIDAGDGAAVAKLRMYGLDGSPVTGEISLGSAMEVAVARQGDNFVVFRAVKVSSQLGEIVAQVYSAAGQPVGASWLIESTDLRNSGGAGVFSGYDGLEVVPLSDGGFAVGWTSTTGLFGSGSSNVAGQFAVVSAQGVVEGHDVVTSASGRAVLSSDADVTFTELGGGKVLATWHLLPVSLQGPLVFGQFARVLDLSGQPLGPAFEIAPVPPDGGPATGNLAGVTVAALAGGKVAFAWVQAGSVWTSQYPADALLQGSPAGRTPPVRLGDAAQADPQIVVLGDGRYVVGYDTNGDVMGQLFSAAGQPEGAAFHIGSVFDGAQRELKLALGPDGTLAAIWEDQSGLAGPGGGADPSGAGVKLELIGFAQTQTGTPQADHLGGGTQADRIVGLAGDDTITGLAGNDTLEGGMGGDSFVGGTGDDRIDGGSNTDFASYADAPSAVTVDLTAGSATGGAGSDRLISIEAAYGSAFNDALTGNYLSNLLVGNEGADTISAMAGSNYIDGGAGTDVVELVGTLQDYFVTNATATGARVVGPFGVDQILNVERVRIGGTEISWQDFTNQAFNGLRYIASNPDLIPSIGTDVERARQHWTNTGRAEGRPLDTFDPLRYAASNPDLAAQFYIDTQALTRHFIQTGFSAGRSTTSFDPLQYGAANNDLLLAFGADAAALTRHYAVSGVAENRPKTGFDPLEYGAANDDLARLFGTDSAKLFQHWINSGVFEGREPSGFDRVAYLLSYPELGAAGVTVETALNHWLTTGADQFLRGDELFGREQASHLIPNNVVTS